jgi:hypothetical protein
MNFLPISGRMGVSLAALAVTAGWLTLMPSAPQSAVRWITDVCTAAARPMFATATAPPGAGSRASTTVRLLSCEGLSDVPGTSAATAVVLEGTIRSQIEGGSASDYKTDQTWFEPPRALHLFA